MKMKNEIVPDHRMKDELSPKVIRMFPKVCYSITINPGEYRQPEYQIISHPELIQIVITANTFEEVDQIRSVALHRLPDALKECMSGICPSDVVQLG